MRSLTSYLLKHAEPVFALAILLNAPLLNYFIPYKLVFMNSYFILILLGTYYLGTRTALMGGVLSTVLITLYVYYFPDRFQGGLSELDLWMRLLAWSGFLILTAALTGKAIDRLRKKVKSLEHSEKQLQDYSHRMELLVADLVNLGLDTESKTEGSENTPPPGLQWIVPYPDPKFSKNIIQITDHPPLL